MTSETAEAEPDMVERAIALTVAWLGNPNTRSSAPDAAAFLQAMHAALTALDGAAAPETPEASAPQFIPAVTERKSLASREHLISLIDGKPYKSLRRHLGTHGLTPEAYRLRYNLKADYPMVAPAYSEARRAMAKAIGLGRKPRETAARTRTATHPETTEPDAPAVKTRARRGSKAAPATGS